VIAADRQVSHGVGGLITVGAPVTKISILGNNIGLFASSGSVSLSQQIQAALEKDHGKFSGSGFQAMVTQLQPQLRLILAPPLEMAQRAFNYMPGVGNDVSCGALLAAKFRDGLRLAEIERLGIIGHLTPEMPYVCLGSGKPNADAILRYLWAIYYPDHGTVTPPPAASLQDGTILAYWTVTVGIKHLKSPYIGFEADVFVLERDGANYKASQIERDQLRLYDQFIDAVEASIRKAHEARGGAAEAEEAPYPEGEAKS
jgi:hypothetical protein